MSEKHSKHYYEQGRNTSSTWKDDVVKDKDSKWSGGEINPKMLLSKDELEEITEYCPRCEEHFDACECSEKYNWSTQVYNRADELDYSKDKIPNYYIGKVYGYEARKVIEDFDLSYNIGTATTYLLRAKRKHTTSVECIQKAINHLEFELDKLKR